MVVMRWEEPYQWPLDPPCLGPGPNHLWSPGALGFRTWAGTPHPFLGTLQHRKPHSTHLSPSLESLPSQRENWPPPKAHCGSPRGSSPHSEQEEVEATLEWVGPQTWVPSRGPRHMGCTHCPVTEPRGRPPPSGPPPHQHPDQGGARLSHQWRPLLLFFLLIFLLLLGPLGPRPAQGSQLVPQGQHLLLLWLQPPGPQAWPPLGLPAPEPHGQGIALPLQAAPRPFLPPLPLLLLPGLRSLLPTGQARLAEHGTLMGTAGSRGPPCGHTSGQAAPW